MSKSKKINVISIAKLQARLFFLFGLLIGVIYSIGGLIVDTLVSIGWVSTPETPGLSAGTVLAFGAIIVLPILFAIFGFVFGIVTASMYRYSSKLFKNIRVDIK